jgi:chromosome segregation ATPase
MTSINWYNVYLGFIFLCNLCFLVGAGFLLYRIVDTMEDTRTTLVKAARENTQAGHELLTAAHRSIREMERASETQLAREISNQRAITELSSQVQNLVNSLRRLSERPAPVPAGAAALGNEAADAATASPPNTLPPSGPADAQREKLRAELTAAMARNHQLQDEISKTVYQLKDVSQANQALVQEIRDLKDSKKAHVDQLLQRAAELEAQLQQASDRAKAAEQLAQSNAFKLENLREDAQNYTFSNASDFSDQAGLIESQQDQIDLLASREKALLERIEAVEDMFKRTQVEKEFIEERFLKLDTADTPQTPPSA